jgi:hypothetical protein
MTTKNKKIIFEESDDDNNSDIQNEDDFINSFNKLELENSYDSNVLKKQYEVHRKYYIERMHAKKKYNIDFRLPSIPEDISENIIKYIIHNKLGDITTTWNCKKGDLFSKKEGVQECKCFTSDGPISFTPTSEWDVIYFLDARDWLKNNFILYRINLKRTSSEWKKIKVNKKETFEEHCKQKRRPRLNWESLKLQVLSFCTKVYEGTFENIFNSEIITEE